MRQKHGNSNAATAETHRSNHLLRKSDMDGWMDAHFGPYKQLGQPTRHSGLGNMTGSTGREGGSSLARGMTHLLYLRLQLIPPVDMGNLWKRFDGDMGVVKKSFVVFVLCVIM